ncbi:MAG TPA: trypsin-like peptidase domain-containing protein [Thermoleophilia bacterium]|nr:trypsin-like peptidase domain-containing protein [Thermoleophilia bacterium]
MVRIDLSPSRHDRDRDPRLGRAPAPPLAAPPGPGARRPARLLAVLVTLLLAAAIVVAGIGLHVLLVTSLSLPGGHGADSFVSPWPRATPLGRQAVSGIAARVDSGLVDINVVLGYPGERGSATGMVLTPSGEVLTNNHVVNGATSITVTDVGNGRTYHAHVTGYDRAHDVAVLQLEGASGLRMVTLGASSKLTPGMSVTAIGNAGGAGGTPKASAGLITALGQAITASDSSGSNAQRLSGLIEIDAEVRPGDSGGPLVNDAGEVVGMNAATSASFASQPAANQAYAIPIDEALAIARTIEQGVTTATVHSGPTAFLGVELIPPGQQGAELSGPGARRTTGAVLGGTIAGYPAQKAGLAQGDVITAVNGRAVTSAPGLMDVLGAYHPGDSVHVQWVDPSGQAHGAAITLASGPPA